MRFANFPALASVRPHPLGPSHRPDVFARLVVWAARIELAWLTLLLCAWPARAMAPSDEVPTTACSARIVGVRAARADASGAPRVAETSPRSIPADAWVPVTLPDRWSQSGRWPDYSGTVWYRVDWDWSCPSGREISVRSHPEVALALASLNLAGEVRVGDSLLWRDQHLTEPLSRSWNMPRYWLLPTTLVHHGRNVLWVRVVGVASLDPGLGQVDIGDPQAIAALHETRWWHQRTLLGANLTLSGALGVLFFLIWLMRRSQHAFGWYALTSLCWVAFITTAVATESWPFPTASAATRASLATLVLYTACFCTFTWRFGDERLPRTERALWALSVLLLLTLALAPEHWLSTTGLGVTLLLAVIFLGNCLQFITHAWRTRQADHVMLAACLAGFIIVCIHDLLIALHLLPGGQPWLVFSSLMTTVCLSAVLGWRIAHNVRQIERFNVELRDNVVRAREDLANTLAREHKLALSHSRLQERLGIAHELHDGLGGALVRSIALVEQAEQPLQNRQFLSILKQLRDDLRQMIDSGSSGGVTVPPTPQQWLAPLRHRFTLLFDELDMNVQWFHAPTWRQPPNALQCLALTRLLEEALTNVIKHSQARHVVVSLQHGDDGHLILRIEDDGRGFDVRAVLRAGVSVGMRSMQARVARVGGTLDVDSAPGHTLLTVHLLPQDIPDSAPMPLL